MKYRFKELVDIPKLQKLTDELFAVTSIPSSIIAMDGEILTGSGWHKICTDFHRKHPEIEKECIESNIKIRKKLEEGDPFVISKCPMGIVNASAPIIIDGEHLANVMSGQVFLVPPDDETENFFRVQARKFGLDETKYMEAFREIPVFTESTFRSCISFHTSLAEIIADMGLARSRELKTLEEERDLIERIMETSPAGFVRVGVDGQVVYANRRAEEILGIKLSETPGLTYDAPVWRITDFDGDPFPEENLPFSVVTRTGRPVFDIQHAIQWPDGKRVFLSINAAPLVGSNGEVEGMVATLEDISVKVETEHNYQMLFQEMIDGFALHEIICDDRGRPVDYRFLAVNPAFERLTGLKSETLIGKTLLEVMPKTEPYWIERYGRVALTGEPVDFENYSRELDRYFHVTAFRPAENRFACIFEDVTRHKLADDALKESEARFRSFMDHFPDHAFIKDKQSRYVYGNRAMLDFWRTVPERFVGTTAHDYLTEDITQCVDLRDRIVLDEHRVIDEEVIVKNRSGDTEWRREIRFPLEMPNGEWLIGGITIDSNELMRGKEERQRLMAAIEQTGECVVITSPDGTPLTMPIHGNNY